MRTAKKRELLKLLVLRNTIRQRVLTSRKYWIHPLNQNRNRDGEHLKLDEMLKNYGDRFKEYTRMSPETFTNLLSLVGSTLKKRDTNFRKSIPAHVRLYIILRFLATGDSFRTIATSFSMGKSTVCKIVYEGLPCLWNVLKAEYVKFPTDWKRISDEFYDRWNLPNCIGAIDGKHVVMESPPHSGSLYFNYKKTYSIVLLATCDAQYNFTTVDVGGYGKQSDSGILARSTLGKKLENEGTRQFCPPRKLPGTDLELSCFFVGDEAFSLTPYMMTPFPGKGITVSTRIFNYRLSRARRCIENAFGIMASRFRIFRKPISAHPKQVERIVLACIALHNFLKSEEAKMNPLDRTYNPVGYGDDSTDSCNGAWRNEPEASGLLSQQLLRITNREKNSTEMRQKLVEFMLNEGAVDWQCTQAGV